MGEGTGRAAVSAHHRWSTDRLAVVVCVAAGLGALAIGLVHKVGGFEAETDFYNWYAPQAQGLLSGQPYTFRHNPPGYIILLAGATLITGDSFVAGKLLSAIATALFGWVTYSLFRALFDARVALGATLLLLLALLPYSFLAAADVVGAVAAAAALWIALRRPSVRVADCVLAGLAAGVAFLVRANALFLVPAIGMALLALGDRRLTPRRLIFPAAFLLAFLALTLPWFVWNTRHNGSPLAGTAHLQVAMHFYMPGGDMRGELMATQEKTFRSLSDVLFHDPVRLARTYLTDVGYRYPGRLATEVLRFPGYLFAGAGLIVLLLNRDGRRMTYLFVNGLGYLLLGLVGFYHRYYLFLFPLLFLLVAHYLWSEDAGSAAAAGPRTPHVRWLAYAAVLASVALAAVGQTAQTIQREPRYLLGIADSLRQRAAPGDGILCGKPHLAQFSGLRRVLPDQQDPTTFLDRAKAGGARFFVYSRPEAKLYPGLEALRDPQAVADRFTLLYRHAPSGTLVYEARR